MVLNLGTRVFTIVGCKTNREHLLSEVTVTYRKKWLFTWILDSACEA